MKCPIDGTDLQMAERKGVEIDYCPKCRGVWLDRGELDKIIESSVPSDPLVERDIQQGRSHGQHGGYGGHRKRKNILRSLFHF